MRTGCLHLFSCRSMTRLVRCSNYMKRILVVALELPRVAAGVMVFILVLPFVDRSMGLREVLGQTVTAGAVLLLFLSPTWLYPKLFAPGSKPRVPHL